MKLNDPIVVIGAGLAGLTAAWALQKSGYPTLVLERTAYPGGRLDTMRADGCIVDTAVTYFERKDRTIAQLLRVCGLDEQAVAIQGGVGTLSEDGSAPKPRAGDFSIDRLALRDGIDRLPRALAELVPVRYGTPVTAVRWDNEDHTFWFEGPNGEPIQDPATADLLTAAGVVLTANPVDLLSLARRSGSFGALAPTLERVRTAPMYVGIFTVPRIAGDYYGFRGAWNSSLEWLAFEEKKARNRAPAEHSIVVAQASAHRSEKLHAMSDSEALNAFWNEDLRRCVKALPESFLWARSAWWPFARIVGPAPQLPANWTNPAGIPLAVAGDWTGTGRLEDAAQSGLAAAQRIVDLCATVHRTLGAAHIPG